MSNFATLPTKVGLPSEVLVNVLDPVMPYDAKSNSIRVYAINNPTVATTTALAVQTAAGQFPDIPFPQTDINFDFPCSQSADTWLDTRLSTLNFRVTLTTAAAAAGAGPVISDAYLRSSAYSYFDILKVAGSDGNLLEFFPEHGLTADTIIQGTMSNSDREGMGHMGFQSAFGTYSNTGHAITGLNGSTAASFNAAKASSFNYSIPLLSGVAGVLSDKFFPIGLVKKMLLTLTTAPILPFTIVSTTVGTAALNATITLTDFWLNLETIKIGEQAMGQIISSLPDGKMYLKGSTYKTTTSLIPAATSGVLNLPIGITGSSVRSLFARFYEAGAAGTNNSSYGKYDSKNPNLNQYGWNIGGIQVPPSLYNPLLYPSQTYRSYLMALGTFNSSQFKSGIPYGDYCKLCAGGVVAANGTTQDSNYSLYSLTNQQCEFLLGENLETIPRRGLLSGRDLTFQKVNLVLSTAVANTNAITVYTHALLDCVTIVDVHSGSAVTII